jgi:hypothetical protein
MLQDCPAGQDFCQDEVQVDWLPSGGQLAFISRGCASSPASETCQTSNSPSYNYLDCASTCDAVASTACNTNLNVFGKIEAGNQDSCYQCYDKYFADGTVAGNDNCIAAPNVPEDCPAWANQGCFTSR